MRRREERWDATREYFCGNYACSIHKEQILLFFLFFFLKCQRTVSCTWIIWFPVPLLSLKYETVVDLLFNREGESITDFKETCKLFDILVVNTEEKETSERKIRFAELWIFIDRSTVQTDSRPIETNELKKKKKKTVDLQCAQHTRARSLTESAICGCGRQRISRKSCIGRLSWRVNHEGQMSVLLLSRDDMCARAKRENSAFHYVNAIL